MRGAIFLKGANPNSVVLQTQGLMQKPSPSLPSSLPLSRGPRPRLPHAGPAFAASLRGGVSHPVPELPGPPVSLSPPCGAALSPPAGSGLPHRPPRPPSLTVRPATDRPRPPLTPASLAPAAFPLPSGLARRPHRSPGAILAT